MLPMILLEMKLRERPSRLATRETIPIFEYRNPAEVPYPTIPQIVSSEAFHFYALYENVGDSFQLLLSYPPPPLTTAW